MYLEYHCFIYVFMFYSLFYFIIDVLDNCRHWTGDVYSYDYCYLPIKGQKYTWRFSTIFFGETWLVCFWLDSFIGRLLSWASIGCRPTSPRTHWSGLSVRMSISVVFLKTDDGYFKDVGVGYSGAMVNPCTTLLKSSHDVETPIPRNRNNKELLLLFLGKEFHPPNWKTIQSSKNAQNTVK